MGEADELRQRLEVLEYAMEAAQAEVAALSESAGQRSTASGKPSVIAAETEALAWASADEADRTLCLACRNCHRVTTTEGKAYHACSITPPDLYPGRKRNAPPMPIRTCSEFRIDMERWTRIRT